MNLTQALVAKLKGKHVDCTKCQFWVRIAELDGEPGYFCARNRVIKTDREMCRFFYHNPRALRVIRYMGHTRITHSELMSTKSVFKATRRYLNGYR